MKDPQRRLGAALLAGALVLGLTTPGQAGTYLVCYLPPDTDQRTLRFCPGSSDAEEGQPCHCVRGAESISGLMTRLNIPDVAGQGPAARMCVPSHPAATSVRLCASYRPEGQTGCVCTDETEENTGEVYNVMMMARIPMRTNQTAAADFLKRLKECCLAQ